MPNLTSPQIENESTVPSLSAVSETRYEEHFTGFIDLLGFSEVSTSVDESGRLAILNLLMSMSALRSEFNVTSETVEGGRRTLIQPAVSTFSDHIVISYPLEPISNDMKIDDRTVGFLILNQFNRFVTAIAASALRIGFLIRGGATIGKLYHSQGIVFGQALVDAYRIESHTSIYPRIVLSPSITNRPHWSGNSMDIVRGDDGLFHLDYFRSLALQSATPGDTFIVDMHSWFKAAIETLRSNLADLEARGKLNELAKWNWFAREFRRGLERIPAPAREAFGLAPEAIPCLA